MTDESQQDHCATRRCVLLGAGVLGAAGILSACSTAAVPYDANQAGQAPAAAGMPTTATMAPSAAGNGAMSSGSMGSPSGGSMSGGSMSSPSGGGSAGGTVLGLAADIPVGGGKVYTTAQVVVTQPSKGQYKAFSAICTHVGCICNQVAGGTINCPCHGAKFKITDGSVVAGPATTPLAGASVTVTGGKIYLQLPARRPTPPMPNSLCDSLPAA
jgi:Rieske Fe-S protein